MKAADRKKNCSASPEQFGAKLDRNVEGAVDNQWQGHTTSSQLTGDARKSSRRRADTKLVCIASPTSKSLNQVVRNAVASCYRGCPNAEAMAGKIALNPRGRENLPQPVSQDCARQRLTVRKKELGARDISLYGEVCQESVNCALPRPIWMWLPWRNGSVFDAFILTWRQVGDWCESIAMSATER